MNIQISITAPEVQITAIYLHLSAFYREKTKELILSQPTEQLSTAELRELESKEIEEESDDPYFSSYGHFSIHEEMLKVYRSMRLFGIILIYL